MIGPVNRKEPFKAPAKSAKYAFSPDAKGEARDVVRHPTLKVNISKEHLKNPNMIKTLFYEEWKGPNRGGTDGWVSANLVKV